MNREQLIFRQGSTTYYWSSKFFPREVRDDVFKLYSFVRVADDYVDNQPVQKAEFRALRRAWNAAYANAAFDTTPKSTDSTDQRVVKNMVAVARKYAFDNAWVEAFLDAMQADLDGRNYNKIEDTLAYVYGSAEVIGLMMAKIMNLSPAAYEAAKLQGRAMQFINFIRDISEDNDLGRRYIPKEDLLRFGLPDLTAETAHAHPGGFKKLIQFELARYDKWQSEAYAGYAYIPRRLRIPLKTAVDMYNWTGKQIAKHPLLIFDRKVKPSRSQVVGRIVRNSALSTKP